MIRNGARAISTIPHLIAAVWLITAFTAETAYCDPFSTERPYAAGQSADFRSRNRIQCIGLKISSAFCSIGSEFHYDRHSYAPAASHEQFSDTEDSNDQPRADLVAVFQLALEEFNLLSGLRLYWNYTEKYINEVSTKLKLKGEISISDPYDHTGGKVIGQSRYLKRNTVKTSTDSPGLLSLFRPQTIKWNVGVTPDDLSVFMDLHLNSHLSFSGEFGDESQVGLYFKFSF